MCVRIIKSYYHFFLFFFILLLLYSYCTAAGRFLPVKNPRVGNRVACSIVGFCDDGTTSAPPAYIATDSSSCGLDSQKRPSHMKKTISSIVLRVLKTIQNSYERQSVRGHFNPGTRREKSYRVYASPQIERRPGILVRQYKYCR